jgi:hypothetical protein
MSVQIRLSAAALTLLACASPALGQQTTITRPDRANPFAVADGGRQAPGAIAPAGTPIQEDRLAIAPQARSDNDDHDGMNWGVGWLLDADVAEAFLPSSSAVCDSLSAQIGAIAGAFRCTNDTRAKAWSADLGITFVRFIAIKVGYLDLGRINFDAAGSANGIDATATGFFGRTRGVTLEGAFRLDVGPVVPFVQAGVWGWRSEVGGSLDVIGVPLSGSASRTATGWNPIFGAGLEFWPVRHVGFSAGVRFVKIHQHVSDVGDLVNLNDTFRVAFVGLKLGDR